MKRVAIVVGQILLLALIGVLGGLLERVVEPAITGDFGGHDFVIFVCSAQVSSSLTGWNRERPF